MRKLPPPQSSLLHWKSLVTQTRRYLFKRDPIPSLVQTLPSTRHLAQVRGDSLSELWFSPSSPPRGPADDLLSPKNGNGGNHKPPDERTLKLGKTLRTLSPLLPNILTSAGAPPPEILSPNISLHLFPSTHPHLPAVKGRVPYRAALWTAPVAWGCVPLVGNVKLEIVSERIVRTGYGAAAPGQENEDSDLGEEKLVVRWKTEKKDNGVESPTPDSTTTTSSSHSDSSSKSSTNRSLSALLGGDKPIFALSANSSFTGLFIFAFDRNGRIASHTIEHADESNGFDRTNRVVTLTDWLIGKAKWGRTKEDEMLPVPGLAMQEAYEERERSLHERW